MIAMQFLMRYTCQDHYPIDTNCSLWHSLWARKCILLWLGFPASVNASHRLLGQDNTYVSWYWISKMQSRKYDFQYVAFSRENMAFNASSKRGKWISSWFQLDQKDTATYKWFNSYAECYQESIECRRYLGHHTHQGHKIYTPTNMTNKTCIILQNNARHPSSFILSETQILKMH